MKNILEICQDVADVACVQAPTTLFDKSSQNARIFLSVAKDALNGLLRIGDWQELTKDGCLVTVKCKKDYLIKTFCPDFFQLLNNTVYIKNDEEKVIGAIRPEQWQKEKFFGDVSCGIKFKIQNSMFRFLQEPPEGVKIVFQYRSANVVFDGGMFTEKTEITADSDIPIFDEYLVKLAIRWRLQARNGLDYSEEYLEYQQECKKRFGAGLASRDIVLSGCENTLADGGVAYVKKEC
ncbi:MAG: hypothetical protein J6Y53_00585 [Alphaproteobacteria bacterium]|nr:hypothetical protein [Alphaproteobacteria bacterium]